MQSCMRVCFTGWAIFLNGWISLDLPCKCSKSQRVLKQRVQRPVSLKTHLLHETLDEILYRGHQVVKKVSNVLTRNNLTNTNIERQSWSVAWTGFKSILIPIRCYPLLSSKVIQRKLRSHVTFVLIAHAINHVFLKLEQQLCCVISLSLLLYGTAYPGKGECLSHSCISCQSG